MNPSKEVIYMELGNHLIIYLPKLPPKSRVKAKVKLEINTPLKKRTQNLFFIQDIQDIRPIRLETTHTIMLPELYTLLLQLKDLIIPVIKVQTFAYPIHRTQALT